MVRNSQNPVYLNLDLVWPHNEMLPRGYAPLLLALCSVSGILGKNLIV